MPLRKFTKNRLKSLISFFLLPPILIVGGLLAVDLYLHNKYSESFGLNRAGFRGDLLGPKDAGEERIITLGGSTTFGYGVDFRSAWPKLVEDKLNDGSLEKRKAFRVINAGYNNEGSYAYTFNLNAFNKLDYDYVLMFSGVNDSSSSNYTVFRNNPIFNNTGYFPILPIIFMEKMLTVGYEGRLEEAYKNQVELSSDLSNRIIYRLMRIILSGYNSMVSQETSYERVVQNQEATKACNDSKKYVFYCRNLVSAIEFALGNEKRVILVLEPFYGREYLERQLHIGSLIENLYSKEEGVVVLNYTEIIDVQNKDFSFDKMHLTNLGHSKLANIMVRDFLKIRKDFEEELAD